ncbi:hypothetical protein NAC44_12030 [Allorhizobium sp. BGMRC 0089]|uniref:hypothetical protein n=1 Tax=Allorhizobium sonneratiae TaxID=2934936 RepID=UPI00203426D6|nr:hypothetical protein [Allorhizobium sonneratiae]MCM2293051.1 hypothetical protein [Allorhizobium sonneratiae]
MAAKKPKKHGTRSFKNRVVANTDFEFIGLGNQHTEIKLTEIDNPHYSRAHAGASGNPKTTTAALNLRESPIAMMAAKGHLTIHQVEAAIKFRRLWEALGGAGAGSFDYSREPVDGGGVREPITDRQIDAGSKLDEARKHIGSRCYDIVEKVAGEGIPVSQLGASHREKTTLADYLRNALDDLSDLWGMKTKPSRRIANL